MPGRIGGQLQSPCVCKMTIRIICRPELIDRKQEITHGGYATYIGQSEIDDTVPRVSGGQWQAPYSDARTRLPIYSRNCFSAWFCEWRSLRRAVRVATRARGLEEMRKSTQVACGVFFTSRRASDESSGAFGYDRCDVAGASASSGDNARVTGLTGSLRDLH
eukprot:6212735-Pleurochrysis_carterae.AAC.5